MSWPLTEEQRMIQLMVRDFARREIEPHAAEWDRKGSFPFTADMGIHDTTRWRDCIGMPGSQHCMKAPRRYSVSSSPGRP